MKLHNDKQNFYESIEAASSYYGIDRSLIEKDYFVTLFLKSASEKIPGLVFKGGTSLSKCHKIIDRFSEDIDLTLDTEHYSQSKKRKANKTIIEICDELGFALERRDFLVKHSHANYNGYNVEYPVMFPSDSLRPGLKVEMVFIQKTYPDIDSTANSYIGEYLKEIGRDDIIAEYDLSPFPIKVQTLERTLVDKVFALCDYYLRDEESRNSRHIYDISRILTKVKINNELKTLVESVREVRKPNKTSLSAQDGVDVPELLKKIVDSGFFKKDYESSTEKLLIKPVRYADAIKSLETIIDSGLFANNKKTPVDDEYAPPSVIYEKRKAERRAEVMKGRGPETLVGLTYIGVYEDAKEHYAKHGIKTFENLYYGDQVYDGEEENERKLMELLVSFCGGDRERLITVFKSSGQYSKDKPDDYYDKMADACLKDIADMSEKTKRGNNIKQSDFSSKKDKDSGNSK